MKITVNEPKYVASRQGPAVNRIAAGGPATAEALRRGGHQGAITLVGDEAELPYDHPPLSEQILKGEWEPTGLPCVRKGTSTRWTWVCVGEWARPGWT
jgi:hypothetical protein